MEKPHTHQLHVAYFIVAADYAALYNGINRMGSIFKRKRDYEYILTQT